MKSKYQRYKESHILAHQNENDQNQRPKQSEEEKKKKKDIFKGATKILIADFSFQ